jgi:hypothetical protein
MSGEDYAKLDLAMMIGREGVAVLITGWECRITSDLAGL